MTKAYLGAEATAPFVQVPDVSNAGLFAQLQWVASDFPGSDSDPFEPYPEQVKVPVAAAVAAATRECYIESDLTCNGLFCRSVCVMWVTGPVGLLQSQSILEIPSSAWVLDQHRTDVLFVG